MAVSSFATRTDVVSWGRVTREPQRVARPQFRDELPALLNETDEGGVLPIGMGRSYGDSCLNGAGRLIDMTALDRFVHFDATTGALRAEAGVSLSHILHLVVPHGWFTPTTPGTRFVTLGGAIANDVHGKNHHGAGSFGRHVRAVGLLRSDRGRVTATPDSERDLFSSTIGGLGLTGVIEWAEVQLVRVGSAYLDVETLPFHGLEEFWTLAEDSVQKFEHTVAWIDSTARGAALGRGIFSRANWLADGAFEPHDDRSTPKIPVEAPGFMLNRLSVAAFNNFYHRSQSNKAGKRREHFAPYFYPLDAIQDWNKMYGPRGLVQYQCAIPPDSQRDAVHALLDVISASGQASFLAVLKTFGDLASPGLLSFPRLGATLALDFPFRGVKTLTLLDRLDAIVHEARGALYPAKDGRMPAKMFRLSFPRWEQLVKDPAANSDFWRRVSQ